MNIDDPKFTACVLGEFDDLTPAERAEIEALLASDPVASAEGNGTRAFAARLRRELALEQGSGLTEAQRAGVLSVRNATSDHETAPREWNWRQLRGPLALAAAVAVFAGAAVFREWQTAAPRPDWKADAPQSKKAAVAIPEPTSETKSTPAPALEVAGKAADGLQLSLQPAQQPLVAALDEKISESSSLQSSVQRNGSGGERPAADVNAAVAQPAPQKHALDRQASLRETPSIKQAPVLLSSPSYAMAGEGRDKTLAMDQRRGGPLGELSQNEPGNTAAFDAITDHAFLAVRENPLSTFSIDVDTASYAIVRRYLQQNQLPPPGAVRIEELLNYFTYEYPQPTGDTPFSATMEVATCPWAPEHRLVRIGLKGREIARDQRPAGNLVFLIDVSGSMEPANRLPLLRQSLALLVDQLGEKDSVAIAVYAGASGCVLEPTHDKAEVRAALENLKAGGSTNGASGIRLAYQLAERSFIKGGTNRVILATDGDFNVGVTNQSELINLIEKKAKSGVFLTVLGFGMDNLKDSTLEKLADKGNGNYAYIDTLAEGKKVLVEQMSGTLITIAKDVKIQVEFNPAQAAAYRLIGYENRLLKKEDFNDDAKDAGEIGAGHTVTALYEIVPAGAEVPSPAKVDALKYQRPVPESAVRSSESGAAELLTLKLRYKVPEGETSKLVEFPLTDPGTSWEKSSPDFRFAAAVASYGMLLRDSPHKGSATWNSTLELAAEGRGKDGAGYRAEFISLVEKARALAH